MRRSFLAAALAVAGLLAADTSAFGLRIAFKPAPQRAVTADAVVVGKVTAIEKDTVDAVPHPNVKEKVAYKVAVVKIESNLGGATNLTHIKIGFIPRPKVRPGGPVPVPPVGRPAIQPVRPIRTGMQAPELKVGSEMLFFLVKHPTAEFYVMPGMT